MKLDQVDLGVGDICLFRLGSGFVGWVFLLKVTYKNNINVQIEKFTDLFRYPSIIMLFNIFTVLAKNAELLEQS